MNARRILHAILPFVADRLLPGLLAAVNPQARPGLLLDAERWLDG